MGQSVGILDGARSVLRRYWNHADFRWSQRRIIVAAASGRDVLAVLPTGGGKSICYQIPALLLPGTTLVVSPLISLMQDQVATLQRLGVAAAYLSSTQSRHEQAGVWRVLREGGLKLLYVAPERLGQIGERADDLRVPLLAVDEAHCVSEWGHDFRPHYRTLGRHRAALGSPPTIALTATATPDTRRDVTTVLRLRRPVRVIQSFDRPNLRFFVRRFRTERDRLRRVRELLTGQDGTAIVYAPTRNRTDGVAQVLRRWGVGAWPYHAGLPANARQELLEGFAIGRYRVMVATNAFGMGIDRSDVRLVVHVGVPTRPEAYYQEAGRAGRDGHLGECHLLWVPDDLKLASAMATAVARGTRPRAEHLRARRRGFDAMRRYVTGRACRRRVLLEYLGERPVRCDGCDRCDGT